MSQKCNVLERPRKQRKIGVDAVRAALQMVAEDDPGRVDRRAEDSLDPRYMDQGHPNCLVAMVLVKLGISTGVLRQLDREYPTGELCQAGVRVEESRHPALRKIDTQALRLLQWVQDEQDRGRAWGRIVSEAFKARDLWRFERWDKEKRPWLYA